ncbi:MAG TPA: hypothetical protein VHX88_17945 [Solirubrobacteraceae bacterium]|jgi:hypothetical protein|nr:hypothetical protein [Solirubrobacteraceae bacterium]
MSASRAHQHDHRALNGMPYALPAFTVLAGLVIMCLGSDVELEGGAGSSARVWPSTR